ISLRITIWAKKVLTKLPFSPEKKARGSIVDSATQTSDHKSKQSGCNKPIDPIKNATVSRYDLARIFHACLTFQMGFKQITELGDGGNHTSEYDHRDQARQAEHEANQRCCRGTAQERTEKA